MKPWLLDILACPIDKHYPLELYIFNFDTELVVFNEILSIYENREINEIKSTNFIEFSEKDNKLRDSISIEFNSITNYIGNIVSSIKELENIIDRSNNQVSKKCLEIILSQVQEKIINFSQNADINKIENILPELFLLNKYKVGTEIESGILLCKKCYRWYPIMETIPILLSDEFRDEKKEKEFLSQAIENNLLDDKFIKQELKPYKI